MRELILDCNNENFTIRELNTIKEACDTFGEDIKVTIRKAEIKDD